MASTYILIPAYNEATVIGKVVKKVKDAGYTNVIVIDDCSTDNTAATAKKAGARVISHNVNKGAGAATRSGLELAKAEKADFAVTIDDALMKISLYKVAIITPSGLLFINQIYYTSVF